MKKKALKGATIKRISVRVTLADTKGNISESFDAGFVGSDEDPYLRVQDIALAAIRKQG